MSSIQQSPAARLILAGALSLGVTLAAGAASAHLAALKAGPPSSAGTPASNADDYIVVQDRAANTAQVILSCMVTDTGGVQDCSVLSEDPMGAGYGAAALQMAPQFKFATKAEGGEAVPGARLHIPVRIRIAK